MESWSTARAVLCQANYGISGFSAISGRTAIPVSAVARARGRPTAAATVPYAGGAGRRGFSHVSVPPAARPLRPLRLSTALSSPSSTCYLPSCRLPLHTTPVVYKKKEKDVAPSGKGNKSHSSAPTTADEDHHSSSKADPVDPYDMKDVDEALDRLAERTDEKLKSLRQGGRFNPASIGRVPVRLSSSSSSSSSSETTTTPLEEVALIDIKSGRIVQLTLFEASHRKAVMSAIQSSPLFNQQPQPDPDDDTILTLKVEPEQLDEQLKSARDMCHAWREGIRKVTAARSKRHAAWRKDKVVGADDVVKLGKQLQKLQDKRMASVDAAEKTLLQTLRKNHGNAF